MFKNYFKIAFRNIVRHEAFATVNIAGLAIGMACSIFILLWVQNELSYDKFNKNANSIYRVSAGGATNSGPMVPELKAKIPPIKNFVRLLFVQPTTTVFASGTKRFEEKTVFYADSTLLQVFSFPRINGNVETALTRPDAVLITEDMAKKYFGSEDAVGKILKRDNRDNQVVTGVLKNIPANSHLRFDFIMPMSAITQSDHQELIAKRISSTTALQVNSVIGNMTRPPFLFRRRYTTVGRKILPAPACNPTFTGLNHINL